MTDCALLAIRGIEIESKHGRYLFYSCRTGDSWDEADAGDVYWVDSALIEKMPQ